MGVRGCGCTCSTRAVCSSAKMGTRVDNRNGQISQTRERYPQGCLMKPACMDVYPGVSYMGTGRAHHLSLAMNQKIRNLTPYPRVSNVCLGLLQIICMRLFLDNHCKHQNHTRHDRTQSIISQQSPNPNNVAPLLLKSLQSCEVRSSSYFLWAVL